MMDSVVTLLPQPDSPTMHSVSFSSISKETPRRTSYSFLPIRKVVTRSFTSSTFFPMESWPPFEVADILLIV